MIRGHFFDKKAIPALMAGLAFFLAGCQPKPPAPVKVEPVRADPFQMAEEYRQAGDHEKALVYYRKYVGTYPKDKRAPLALKRMADIYLEAYLEATRIPEVAEETIVPEGPQPFIDFDAVFIPDNFERVAMIAPQLAFHDVLGVRLMGTSSWQSPELTEMARDHVQEALFPSGFFPTPQKPGAEAFADEYRAYFDTTPGTLAATAYDTMRWLKGVIKGNQVRTRSNLRDALLADDGFTGVTGSMAFTSEGEAKKTPAILTVYGSAFVEDPLFSPNAGPH